MAKRKSRKRRGRRVAPDPPAASADARAAAPDGMAAAADPPPAGPDPPARGYARSRARDDAARAALKPLRPGERPTAVTVGAVVAALFAVANVVALAFGYNSGEDTFSPGSEAAGSVAATVICGLVAYGMWKARYWGVLGMQTLLALTLVFSSLGLITARGWWAALLLVLIIGGAGTLFWFLVKSMARIQMPERPGR
jgi:hypothetical protein